MANTIVQVRRTSTSGRTPNTTASYATNSQYISLGELALNMADQILYTSDGTNLITVGANSTSYRAASGGANSFVANSTGVYLSQASGAVPLFANGSAGTNGYVLTTNSAGSPYWAASGGGGGGLTGSQIAANNWTFTNAISFSNTVSINTFFTNVFSAGVGTITTSGTTTTFNNLTQYYQHVVGTSTQTIKLPDETTILPGGTYLIDNDGSANITINDSAGGFLATAIPGMGVYAWSYTNSAATGNWGTYTLVPSGLMANNTNIVGTGQQNTTITANGYVTTFDYSGNLTVANNLLTQSVIQNRYSGQMYALQSGFGLL